MWAVVNLARFFGGPAGRLLLIVLAFVGWGVYQRMDATRDCEDAELRRELVATVEQLREANEVAERARERASEARSEMQRVRDLAEDLRNEIEERGDGCAISPADRERLLEIR